MNHEEIKSIIESQRAFFAAGKTLSPDCRIQALKRLYAAIVKYEDEINEALQADLGKSGFESYMCEVGLTLSEITYMIKHTRGFAREKRVPTPLSQFAARSYTKPVPYGVTLIMSPWNYPFLLTINPLANALAAGNTAVIKPSAYSPHSSQIIEKIITECFDPSYVTVVLGGRQENSCLLQEPFDHIFFTGSQAVGREVMRHAAEHLTPVTLELGGKSPCIVDRSAKLSLAARRIVFGKFLNCGQTCVAPDYIYCDPAIKDDLIGEIIREIKVQFGERPLENEKYGRIINEKHFRRITGLIPSSAPEQTAFPEQASSAAANAMGNTMSCSGSSGDNRAWDNPASKVVFGGAADPTTCRIEPTILDGVTWDDPVMQEEIFGPVLPVLTYDSLEDAVRTINAKPHPLALYLFSSDKAHIRYVTSRCQFGGGCINDTIIHLATSQMGFGGVGASGMGSYHGKTGFETFSHRKSIVDKKTWIDLPMRYQPYRQAYEKIARIFLK